MMLKENPRLLNDRKGRQVFKDNFTKVKGSPWEEVFAATAEDLEVKKFRRQCNEINIFGDPDGPEAA